MLRTPLSHSPCWSLCESAQRRGHVVTARLDFEMSGMKAAQKVAAAPMRTSAQKLEMSFFAYGLRGQIQRARCRARMHGFHAL